MAIDNMMPGSGLPTPVEAEGVLPEEEEVFYESVGFPLLIDLLQKAQAGSQSQMAPASSPGRPMSQVENMTLEHVRSRNSQGLPVPRSRFEAASNLLRAKRSRVNNPGVPRTPNVAQVVNQAMASAPQQMSQPPQSGGQMQQRTPNRMQQARQPEVYKPLRQEQASQAPRPMQAIDTNKMR